MSAIEELKTMQTQLMSCTQNQLNNLQQVDTKQLGEAIDMIKDLSESIYYTTITESMQKVEKKEDSTINNVNYYTNPMTTKMYPDYRDMERMTGYMYYPNSTSTAMPSGGSTNYYTEMPYERNRDPREGRAAVRRRMYMEGKEQHKDKNSQLKELEAYLQELSADITEMIKDASTEERATLRQKMTTLANKIN